MKQEKLFTEILDSYYGESSKTLEDIAKEHGVSVADCQKEQEKISIIAKRFSELKECEPSQMSINKVLVYANEKANSLKKKSLWQYLMKPSFGFSVILLMVFSTFVWYQIDYNINNNNNMASFSAEQLEPTTQSPIVQRLYSTPLDSTQFVSRYFKPTSAATPKAQYINSFVSNVSLHNNQDSRFNIDDDLERKMMSRGLNNHDLETLYFRARKLEKQSYYKEALHDYLLISKYYPKFEYNESIPLAMARCYEKLGSNNQAVQILENYQNTKGNSEDIQLWIDLLKSETF